MKFLPKKDDIFGVKKLILSTSSYDLFSYQKRDEHFSMFKYSNKKCVKKIISILKAVKSNHVMNIIQSKENSLYTSPIIPLQNLENDISENYKEYILISLGETILFLNEKCQIRHNNIHRESIFVDQTGSFVLCGFEKAEKISEMDDSQNDMNQFLEISVDLCRKERNLSDLKQLNNFYISLYAKAVTIPVMKDYELLKFINFFRKEQIENNIPHIVREYIGRLILHKFLESREIKTDKVSTEIEKKVQSGIIETFEHSKYVFFYFIVLLDLKEYDFFFENFLSVLDTNFRIELLKKHEFFVEKISNWSDKSIFNNLVMGLRCKDHELQIRTINVLKNTLSFYKQSQIKEITKLLSFCKFEQTIDLLNQHSQIFLLNDQKGLLKLLFTLLDEVKLRLSTLSLIKKNFQHFNYKKLCTVLLPFLCEMIIEFPIDELFETIRSILDHLQKNKEDIDKIEIKTRVKKWLPFFKNNDINKLKKTANISDKEITEEQEKWEDDW